MSVPVLSKAKARDAGEPFQGRAALDEHAGARQPAQAAMTAAGVARISGTRAGDHQHRQRRVDGDIRGGQPSAGFGRRRGRAIR